MKKLYIYLFVGLLCFSFVSSEEWAYNYLDADSSISINETSLNVNNSQYLQGYTPLTLRNWMEDHFDLIYATITDLADYLPLSGGTMEGDINMDDNDIYSTGNITTNCITLGDGEEYCSLATTFYNATNGTAVRGTIAGTINLTQHPDGNYDGITFNVTEKAGAIGLDLRVNFTGVSDFNKGYIRYRTSSLSGDYPEIQLWDYDDGEWEGGYGYLSENVDFLQFTNDVLDSSYHIQDNVVQMRLYKSANGNTNNIYYIDMLAIVDGYATPSGNVDLTPYWRYDDNDEDRNFLTEGNVTANIFNGDWNGSSSYVPYTGATSDVDLGSNKLTTNGTGTFLGDLKINKTINLDYKNMSIETGEEGSGGYFSFDGSGDYVSGTSSDFCFENTTFTVSGWFKTTASDGCVISNDGVTGGWTVRISNGYIYLITKNGAYVNSVEGRTTSAIYDDGEWHFFAITVTTNTTTTASNDMDFFVDGVDVDEFLPKTNPYSCSSNNWRIGVRRTTSTPFNGSIDEVMIFNKSLTPAQITEIYNLGRNVGCYSDDSLISMWNADDETADDCKDGNNGTLVGDTQIITEETIGRFDFKRDGEYAKIKANDYITASRVYDKNKGNALDLIKDSDEWKVKTWYGTITNEIDYKKHYAYDKEMNGLSMETRIATLEQAIYELNEEKNIEIEELQSTISSMKSELCEVSNSYSWCKMSVATK